MKIMVKKICPVCGLEFVTDLGKVYCCNKCQIYGISHRYNKICEFCGEEFIGRKTQRFCSVRCSQSANYNLGSFLSSKKTKHQQDMEFELKIENSMNNK